MKVDHIRDERLRTPRWKPTPFWDSCPVWRGERIRTRLFSDRSMIGIVDSEQLSDMCLNIRHRACFPSSLLFPLLLLTRKDAPVPSVFTWAPCSPRNFSPSFMQQPRGLSFILFEQNPDPLTLSSREFLLARIRIILIQGREF